VLNKANYNIPWIKAESQTTKHAVIRMLLWQDIAVLRDTTVLSLRLAWSYFAIKHEYTVSVIHTVSLVYSKRQRGPERYDQTNYVR